MTEDPRPLADGLAAVARDLRLGDVRAVESLRSRWAGLVDEATAAHSDVAALRDGVLTVWADGPEWASRVRYLEGRIRAGLAATSPSPAVSGIVVRVRRPTA